MTNDKLTYDFNSYCSLGAGWNSPKASASFGINGRAFEAVVAGLVGL